MEKSQYSPVQQQPRVQTRSSDKRFVHSCLAELITPSSLQSTITAKYGNIFRRQEPFVQYQDTIIRKLGSYSIVK